MSALRGYWTCIPEWPLHAGRPDSERHASECEWLRRLGCSDGADFGQADERRSDRATEIG